MKTCFGEKSESVTKVCILIDLPDLALMNDNRFLEDSDRFRSKQSLRIFLSTVIAGRVR